MWEEGVRIYGTPGVHNNFPLFSLIEIQDTSPHQKKPLQNGGLILGFSSLGLKAP